MYNTLRDLPELNCTAEMAHHMFRGAVWQSEGCECLSAGRLKLKLHWQQTSTLMKDPLSPPTSTSAVLSSDLVVGVRLISGPKCYHKLPDSSCDLKQFGRMSRVSHSSVLWHPAGLGRGHGAESAQGADLNHSRTRAQLSLAVVIIPRPVSDRWHCGISDFMAGHLSYPISFPI